MAANVLCGVPDTDCVGARGQMIKNWRGSLKMHATHEDAFNCYGKYLRKLGYTRISSREYAAPNDGPIHVLTRKSRFGQSLRPGKGDKGGRGTKLRMPTKRHNGAVFG